MATTQTSSRSLKIKPSLPHTLFLLLILLTLTTTIRAQDNDSSTCASSATDSCYNKQKATKIKVIAIFSILISSIIGISLPLLSRSLPSLHPDRDLFIIVKALASGVILSTGFMHVLPDSWNNLTSECLPEEPWRVFPITTFVTMVTAVLTMAMDTIATAYFKKKGSSAAVVVSGCTAHVHNRGTPEMRSVGEIKEVDHRGVIEEKAQLLRYRIIAQVLEMGIVVHSVVIGLSMGVSNNPCTITPLVAAMCFHQLFEGMGLGGCIIQAEYKIKMKAIMVLFFSVTTPFGIALGMGLLNIYRENSPTALIVVGLLNAISAGLLIYMALVDLLATDFMGPKLQANIKLQLIGYGAALLGMGGMSLMAKWA